MRRAFSERLSEMARVDQRIWLLSADLGFGALDSFRALHSGRFVNGGIAEHNLVGVAAGLALTGKIPFVYSASSFLAIRALEQLKLDVAIPRLDVRLVGVGAGVGYGHAGPSHYSTDDISALLLLPEVGIYCPADAYEVAECLDEMMARPGPAYLRLANETVPRFVERPRLGTCGSPIRLNSRHERALLCVGRRTNHWASRAADLDRAGVSLVHIPVIRPIDEDRLDSLLRGCTIAYLLDDQVEKTGLFAWLSARLISRGSATRLISLGFRREPIERYGSSAYLESKFGCSDERVARELGLA